MANPFMPTALDPVPVSAATRERFRRTRRPQLHEEPPAPTDHIVTRIEWSAGDDDEHAWFWCATNAAGRTLAYGYAHAKDEVAVIKQCGESGADVAEGCEWVME